MLVNGKQTLIVFIAALILGYVGGLYFPMGGELVGPLPLIVCGSVMCIFLSWKKMLPSARWQLILIIILFLFGFLRIQEQHYQSTRFVAALNVKAATSHQMAGRVVAVRSSTVEVVMPGYPVHIRGYFHGEVDPFSSVAFTLSPRRLDVPTWGEPVRVKFAEFRMVRRSPFKGVYELRDHWTQIIIETMRPPLGAWFRLLLLGDEGMPMDPSLQAIFKYLGIMHLMVVSGAQIGILSQLILAITCRLPLPIWVEALTIVGIQGLFALMVGGGVSVWRAMIMAAVAYYAFRSRRQLQGVLILELTALVMLITCPVWIGNLGFWLSILATWGLIEMSPKIEKILCERLFWPKGLAAWFAVMMGPLWLTAPLILLLFHRFDILSLISNMLIVPLVEWIVVTGFAVLGIISFLPGIAPVLLAFEEGLMAWVYQLVQFFSSIVGMTLYLPFTPWPVIIGWFGVTFLLLRAPTYLRQHLRVFAMFIGVIVLLQGYQVWNQPHTWCFFQQREGAWVIVAHQRMVHVAFMNHDGQTLYESIARRYPFLESSQRVVLEERWIHSGQRRQMRAGNVLLASVGHGSLDLREKWPSFIVSFAPDKHPRRPKDQLFRVDKNDLAWGKEHWPLDKGVVLVWEGRYIRILRAIKYFS